MTPEYKFCDDGKVILKNPEMLSQRTWVGLSEEDKQHIEIMGGKSDVMLAEMVEAKLKEKNNG
jgi:hypothetical protein